MGDLQVTRRDPVAPPLSDVESVEFGAARGRFRCDPFACASVCCTDWPEGEGVSLTLDDLDQFARAGLLHSVTGRFPTPKEARGLLEGDVPARRPEMPRLLSIDHHCVHFDPASRRCRIHEHRPLACRAFPYDMNYGADGSVAISFGPGCSLVTGSGARHARTLRVGPSGPAVRLRNLPTADRAHAEACIALAHEELRTLRVLAEGPDHPVARNLARFVAPATSHTRERAS